MSSSEDESEESEDEEGGVDGKKDVCLEVKYGLEKKKDDVKNENEKSELDLQQDLIVVRSSVVEKNANKKKIIDPYASSSSSSSSSSTSSSSASSSSSRAAAYYVELQRDPLLQAQRTLLPVCGMEQEIMEAISEHSFILLCGETGSGKTTQLPQFLYEAGYGSQGSSHPGMIGITQPRRVAALSVAKRVAEEMNVPYGGPHSKVAHQVRYDSKTVKKSTVIKFMTDGILLKGKTLLMFYLLHVTIILLLVNKFFFFVCTDLLRI